MNKEFIPYEEALALKELGFNEPCIYYVDKNNNSYIYDFQKHPDEFIDWCGGNVVKTPLYQQAFRWFRDKHNLLCDICLWDREDLSSWKFEITVIGEYEMLYNSKYVKEIYDSYEEAELACLRQLIKTVHPFSADPNKIINSK